MKGRKILLIEDEHHIGHGLMFNLEQEGALVKWAKTGEEGLSYWRDWKPHGVILDLMLPDSSGFKILNKIKEVSETPVLILSAKDQDNDKVKGLKLGCNDYLTKPFNLEELLLRVHNLVKQLPSVDEEELSFGNWKLSPIKLEASFGKEKKVLTPQEFKILKVLIKNKGKIVSRSKLLIEALGYTDEVESRTIDNFIVRLRKYFEENPKAPQLIKSVRGAGYIYNSL